MQNHGLIIGIDVGSTTVKAVVVDSKNQKVLWSDYQRHETRQPEKAYEFLQKIESKFGPLKHQCRVFMTGSGASSLAPLIGAKFVQEVNAVSLAVETYHQDVGSVIELGGQDAKIIIWQTDPKTGARRKLPSMNDRCAGGTGAVIDKIATKLQFSLQDLKKISFQKDRLHPVAGKCGVFAETDINGLQKQGVPPEDLMASLFDALVQQNLLVLTRGNTLLPKVLLLGGPNTFIPAMVEAWKANIPQIWKERNVDTRGCSHPEDLILVPKNAEYYAALGAVIYGKEEPQNVGVYLGLDQLKNFIQGGRVRTLASGQSDTGLVQSKEEYENFKKQYSVNPPLFPSFQKEKTVEAWMGIDGGSTSTKGVLIDKDGKLLAQAYQLSKGNPIADTQEIIAQLKLQIEAHGPELICKGVGTTGYAKDILKETFGADVALVETVAHTKAALHYYHDADVIVDVGGQDIKVIFLKNGVVKDFKLNTQCSAGNGYFLQNTANRFGIPVEDYAKQAFEAKVTPVFSYGCAVFLESDIVNFQRLGWQSHEIMAGLAKVLPKNIWLYVVQEPNLQKFGTRFILQGGTQKNLAAVKSQTDYIKERIPHAQIQVHQYCGVTGAIGCAMEALSLTIDQPTTFIGLDESINLSFHTKRDEETRCYFCKNQCLRTFVNTKTSSGKESTYIMATCEKGTVTDVSAMKKIRTKLIERSNTNPSLVAYTAKRVFETFDPEQTAQPDRAAQSIKMWRSYKKPSIKLFRSYKKFKKILEKRGQLIIGMPRVLNMYSTAPFFTAYLEALGVKNIVWSDFTSEKLFREGGRRGSIDPCFPSKLAISHVHNLVYKKKIDVLFFPTIISLKERLQFTKGSWACPSVQSAANVCKAGFTKEENLFTKKKIKYIDNALHMDEPNLLDKQMYEAFVDILDLGFEENRLAVNEGWKALDRYHAELVQRGQEVLKNLEAHHKVGLLVLSRPYHHDPGINHEILDRIQLCGYPILAMDSLPDDDLSLKKIFGQDIAQGLIQHPKDISDVFGNPYSTNTNMKIWAAKYAARHPNLAVIDLSSFKCGMDAPIYHVIEGILESTKTPFFTFHDIDENKPAGSIKIRVETIVYALKQYENRLKDLSKLSLVRRKTNA